METGGHSGVGEVVMYMVYAPPVVVSLILFEIITLKKKNGYKTLEICSLLIMIPVWLISILAYLFMG